MRISDWSSDVCSTDLQRRDRRRFLAAVPERLHQLGGAAGQSQGRPPGSVLFPSVGDRSRPAARRRRTAQVEAAPLRPVGGDGGQAARADRADRTSVVEGKRVAGRVDLGGLRLIKKKKKNKKGEV